MEIFHHIGFHSAENVHQVFDRLGIEYKRSLGLDGTSFVAAFDIAESDPRWPTVALLAAEHRLLNMPYTTFTREEVLAAPWLRFHITFEKYYPQPENQRRWFQNMFTGGCPVCGVGVTQVGHLRLKSEPKLGRNSFLLPYWVSVLLATPEVFAALRAAEFTGIEQWPVDIGAHGKISEVVSQIRVVHETAGGFLPTEDLKTEQCEECLRIKPNAVRRGKMRYRASSLNDGWDFVRSQEWFGSGRRAFQEALVSNRVARLVLERGWRGVDFQPLELE